MSKQQFWDALVDGKDLILTADDPAFGSLGAALRDALDHDGMVVVKDAAPEYHDQTIAFSGSCDFPGKAGLPVHGEFQFQGETLRAFFLQSTEPMSGFRVADAWPRLPARNGQFYCLGDAAAFNGVGELTNPYYVLSAGRPEIAVGQRKRAFDDGLHLMASGLANPLPSRPTYLAPIRDLLPKRFLSNIQGTPAFVTARVASHAPIPYLHLDCWWDVTEDWPPEECEWLLKAKHVGLRLNCPGGDSKILDQPKVETIADFGFGPVAAPVYQGGYAFDGRMMPPAPLTEGQSELLALTARRALKPPESAAPDAKHGLSRLRVGTTYAAATVVMLDDQGEQLSLKPFGGLFEVRGLGYVTVFEGPVQQPAISTAYVGTAVFEELPFEIEFMPDHYFRATLEQPSKVDAGNAVSRFFGGSLDLPSFSFTFNDVLFSGTKDSAGVDYEFSMDLRGDLDLTGTGALVLRQVGMFIARSTRPNADAFIRMGGVLELGGVEIAGAATRASGEWTFDGAARFGSQLSFTALAEDLAHKFGSALPASVPNVQLTGLAFSYGLKSKSLFFEAYTAWKMPDDIPWFVAGEHQAGIRISSYLADGKRSTDFALSWNHTAKTSEGKDYAFEAFFHASKTSQNFFLSYDGTGLDGKQNNTLGLSNLVDITGLRKLVQLPEGFADWAIFNFNRLSLGFDRSARSRVFNLAASTRIKGADLHIEAALGNKSPLVKFWWDPPEGDTKATIGIADVFEAFGLTLPSQDEGVLGTIASEFNAIFTFRALSVRYSHRPQPTLVFMAQSNHLAYDKIMIGTAKGVNGKWGQVLCLTFQGDISVASLLHLEDLPSLGSFLKIIKPSWLMICTVDQFDLPDGDGSLSRTAVMPPQFVDSAGNTSTPFGTSRMKIRKGLGIAGSLSFKDGEKGTVAAIIHEQFGIDSIDGRMTFAKGLLEFEAMLPGKIDKKTGKHLPGSFSISTGRKFDLTLRDASVALSLAKGAVGGAIRGACDVTLFGAKATYELDMAVSTNGLDCRVHVPNGIPKLSVAALPGVTFTDEYWLDIGVVFEPAGFKFGVDSGFYIGADPNQYHGKMVIVLDLEGPVPNPIYLAAKINRLDLWAMFEAQYGIGKRLDDAKKGVEKVLAKDNPASEMFDWIQQHYQNLQSIARWIQLEDASFHWCETVVPLPDGTLAQPGIGFQGTLNIVGWKAYGMFEFSSSPFMLMAHIELSSIDLQNVLHITGDGKGVTRNGIQIITPGGPVFKVDSGKSPFLHANLHVSLFDIFNLDVLADVTTTGFRFKLHANAGDIADMQLECFLQTQGGFRFEAHGSFKLHLDFELDPASYLGLPAGALGSFHVNAGLEAHMGLVLTTAQFQMTVGGSFEFEGAHLTMPELTITVPFGSIKNLALKILEHIKDKALHIFGEIWDFLSKTLKQVEEFVVHTAQVAYDKAKEIGAAVANEAKEVYHALEQGAEKIASKVAAAAEEAYHEVSQAVTHYADEALKGAQELGNFAKKQLEEIGKAAEEAFHAAVDKAREIAVAVAEEVRKVAAEIEHFVADVAHKIEALAAEAVRVVGQLIDGARELAKAIAREAEAIVQDIEKAISALWDEINALIRRAAEAVRDAALAVAHGVESIVQAVGSC